MSESPRYKVGEFLIDGREHRVSRGSEVIALRAKVFDTLLALLHNAGRLMTKQQLMSTIWADTHVSENNLNHNIAAIRAALQHPEWIETVAKVGYRFVGPVEQVESVDVSKAAEPVLPSKRPLAGAIAASMLVAAAAISLWALLRSSTPPHSVAVLPFRPVSLKAGDAKLAAGIDNAIAARLATTRGVTVRPAERVAWTDPLEAAKALNVAAVVTGSVQPSAGGIRVIAQMYQPSTQRTVWGRTFDIPSDEITAVEDTIALQVADLIAPGLTAQQIARLTPASSRDADARAAYLRGRDLLDRRVRLSESAAQFEFAVRRDPRFALAWAGLGEALSLPAGLRRGDAISRAEIAARKAIAIDPNLAEAHATLGFIDLFYEWKFAEAQHELARAIALNPQSARFRDWNAFLLITRGRMNDAVSEIKRASQLDPASGDIARDVALIQYLARDYSASEEAARVALQIEPANDQGLTYLAQALERQHRYREALIERGSMPPAHGLGLLQARYRMGQHETRAAIIREIERGGTSGEYGAQAVSWSYAELGDIDGSLRWLERGIEKRDFAMIFIGAEPIYDPYRNDPRFHAIIDRVGLIEPRGAASRATVAALAMTQRETAR